MEASSRTKRILRFAGQWILFTLGFGVIYSLLPPKSPQPWRGWVEGAALGLILAVLDLRRQLRSEKQKR